MIEQIKITKNDIKAARARTKERSFKGNGYSIRRDAGKNLAANIAELYFARAYPAAIDISSTDREADFLLYGKRIDVKCKVRTVPAKIGFDVSVTANQRDARVDYYVFFSYNIADAILELLGWKNAASFYEIARFLSAGSTLDANRWTVPVDCYNLGIYNLDTCPDELTPDRNHATIEGEEV